MSRNQGQHHPTPQHWVRLPAMLVSGLMASHSLALSQLSLQTQLPLRPPGARLRWHSSQARVSLTAWASNGTSFLPSDVTSAASCLCRGPGAAGLRLAGRFRSESALASP